MKEIVHEDVFGNTQTILVPESYNSCLREGADSYLKDYNQDYHPEYSEVEEGMLEVVNNNIRLFNNSVANGDKGMMLRPLKKLVVSLIVSILLCFEHIVRIKCADNGNSSDRYPVAIYDREEGIYRFDYDYIHRICKSICFSITERELNEIDYSLRTSAPIVERTMNLDQAEKVMHEFEKEVHLLTAEPRLKAIAKDFVGHYSDLWTTGKAMFVCLNKVTCVRMYNYVQEYWKQEMDILEQKIASSTSDQEQMELSRKLKWMKDTEMCVVISQEQNEIQTFKKWDLDILSHRTKMEKRELDKEFKDADSTFRVVFVCAMWLTGFDVKTLSCLYLDKPLKAHTLMQTIARANRVAAGKSNGLIIDYIGIVGALKKALNDYTQNKDGKVKIDPTVDKEELIKQIEKAIADSRQLLSEHDFDLDGLVRAEGFKKMALLKDGAEAMCADPETKKSFDTYANEINRLVKYLDRNDITQETRNQTDAISAIFREMQKKRKHIDTTDLMVEINHIINENVEVEQPEEGLVESRQFDISQIDFDLLSAEFAKVRRKNLLIKDLNDLVQDRLSKMMSVNPKRVDYYNRYMGIIEVYNAEQDRTTNEKTFMELMNLAKSMSEEEQRYAREGFSNDEELSIYDLLFSENLSKSDIDKIKKMSVDLLKKIKERIAGMDHWTDKQETRAAVDVLIRDVLFEEIPDSMFDRLEAYRKAIFEHIYTHYKEAA